MMSECIAAANRSPYRSGQGRCRNAIPLELEKLTVVGSRWRAHVEGFMFEVVGGEKLHQSCGLQTAEFTGFSTQHARKLTAQHPYN
jgi:hypothetical protein